jgi:hypothetical protein
MKKKELEHIFSDVANENKWGDVDSISGPGSNLVQTTIIRRRIPELVERYTIKSMLDAPCGDFFWMKEIIPVLITRLDSYIGGDLVPSIVTANTKQYGAAKVQFRKIDLTNDSIPLVDIIFTRDCFIHLSYSNIYKVLVNYKKSDSKYLLLSTYTNEARRNRDVFNPKMLDFRALNMQKFPFFFPPPIEIINEECNENEGLYSDKSLALWRMQDIHLFRMHTCIRLHEGVSILKKILRKIRSLIL